jgi:hypothetical protein
MNKQHCFHFQYLPMGLRMLYTATLLVLGAGYLFAMIYIFESHAGRDGNPGLSVNDLIIAYSGSKSDTRLESALKGPMKNMLPPEEQHEIIAWVRRGASKDDFDATAGKVIAARCETCHSGSNPHIPNLKGFENVSKVAQLDHGMDIFTLVRVSHIHLFGITFIFFIVGSIFCHAYIKPVWLKCIIIVVPFLAILADIGSWYLTKLFPPFAWVVMISGVFMGLAFATEWVTSMWQMWFYKMPDDLVKNEGVVS